jgi:hypothetical protein
LLASVGLEHNARAAAVLLEDLADAFVVDWADRDEMGLQALGADELYAHTLVDEHGQFPPGPYREGNLVDLLLGYRNDDTWE